MEIPIGNRKYKCDGCGAEIYASGYYSGIPHCDKGAYEYNGILFDPPVWF